MCRRRSANDSLPDRAEGAVEETAPDLETVRSYLDELNRLADVLYEVGVVQVQNDFKPLQEILEMTSEDWTVAVPGKRYFRSEAERDVLLERLANDLRQYRLAERDFAFGRGMLTMVHELIDVDSEEALLQKLDTNGNGEVDLTELPENWSELPRTGDRNALETYTTGQLLTEAVSGARILRDKYLLQMAQSLEVAAGDGPSGADCNSPVHSRWDNGLSRHRKSDSDRSGKSPRPDERACSGYGCTSKSGD